MQQTAPPPIPSSGHLQRISRSVPSPGARIGSVGPSPCPNRSGESLLAAPEGGNSGILAELRTRIAALERVPSLASPAGVQAGRVPPAWTLGDHELDSRLAPGLDPAAIHEVKCAPQEQGAGVAAQDWAGAIGFSLRLAVRRLQALGGGGAAPLILWCWQSFFARELGTPHAHGLASLGLAPSACLYAETARAADTLWAMEEGLRSQSLALVIGVVREAELTPARRLSLAAAEHLTPCLLVTDPRLSPAGSTATRWRVGIRAGAAHALDRSAPGASRYAVTLERCRRRPLTREPVPYLLEWSDETHRFRVAAPVADRAHAPRATRVGA